MTKRIYYKILHSEKEQDIYFINTFTLFFYKVKLIQSQKICAHEEQHTIVLLIHVRIKEIPHFVLYRIL